MSEMTAGRAPSLARDAAPSPLLHELCGGLRWRKYHYRRDATGRSVYGRMRDVNGTTCFEALWVELLREN